FRFRPYDLRFVRFVIHEYRGEAVAINNVEVGGEQPGQVYIPTETDVLALANNDVLEIAGGDVVTATYADELTQSELGQSRLLTGRLTATYFNGGVTPVAYDFERLPNGAVDTIRKELMRIDPGDRIIVEIIDYDRDGSDQRDTLKFEVFVNDGEPVEFEATETEPYTGVFTKEVDTTSDSEEGKLQVRLGDRVFCRYVDEQNTFPGHSVPREATVYVREPTDAQVRIVETRVIPPPAGNPPAPPLTKGGLGGVQVTFLPPDPEKETAGVAFEVPLTVEVIDPDAARDSRSTVTVKLTTTDGVELDVACAVSAAFTNSAPYGIENWALREGRFIGQAIMQLGGKNSPQQVPLSADMPRTLIGGPVIPEEEGGTAFERSLVTRVLNLTGNDIVTAGYADKLRASSRPQEVAAKGRLLSNGTLAATDRDYEHEVDRLHVGEKLFLMVGDPDRDTSDQRDAVQVEITTDRGEKEAVALVETLAHSGVFTGSVTLKPGEAPTAGNLSPDDPVIESYFGDEMKLRYVDEAASTADGKLEVAKTIPVVIGTDGLVAAFSKTFNNETLAVETRFHIAESYFELFKSHKKLGRDDQQTTDLEAGRRVLAEVMEDYPDPKYVPRIAYLQGQFAQELAQWDDAIASYELIIRRYPEHTLAADAQYKLAQCHEERGDFDQALESYVTLAATYPKSPLIANVMIRISDRFYKDENFPVAAQVGEKFLEKFESHEFASRMAFRIGQCYYKAEDYPKAGESFDRFGEIFPKDELAALAFFWAGESYRQGNNNRLAFQRYQDCRWKYPETEAAQYARGRLALPEMLQQFEADANAIANDNQ
ncbi:MAG: tetratricopeptide repeat protein, partial [Planctomycetes bacterium]|nr:tetratricopeptide repeat protein [Planctomycetota bacterium]